MLEKIKTDVDGLLSVLIMKTKISVYFAKIKLFFIFETRNGLSTSVFIFSTISQILKTKFHVAWTQTCRSLIPEILTQYIFQICQKKFERLKKLIKLFRK